MKIGVPEGTVKVPSIKGTAFESVFDDVHRLLAEGRLSREELEVALTAEDLSILEQKISPATWYPIASYARLIELLIQKEASGSSESYLLKRGARAAERMSQAGIYQQLHLSSERIGVRVGHIITSVAGAIYNFTRWHFEALGPREFTIRVDEASEFPDVSRFATQGFIERISTHTAGTPMRVVSERPSPDVILYRAQPDAPRNR
jgi:hypothetical protein